MSFWCRIIIFNNIFNNSAIQARTEMAADKEAVGLPRVHVWNLSVSCPYEIIVYSVLKLINTAKMHTISRQFIPIIYGALGKNNTF